MYVCIHVSLSLYIYIVIIMNNNIDINMNNDNRIISSMIIMTTINIVIHVL